MIHSLGHFYVGKNIDIVEDSYKTFESILKDIKLLASHSSYQLLVVIFPQRFQISAQEWHNTVHGYGLDSASFDLEAPNRRVMASCNKFEIDCLDLLESLRQANFENLFFPLGDMHFNARGQSVVANILKDYIINKKRNGLKLLNREISNQ